MSGLQEIEFIIKADGTVEETVSGVSGPACEAVTKAIEDALGSVEERQHTSTYFDETTEAGDYVSSNT